MKSCIKQTRWLVNLSDLISFYAFMSVILIANCNLQHVSVELLLEQQRSLPPPQITVHQQRKLDSSCNSESDEFEFGGESSRCYETIETDFSTEFDGMTVLGTEGDRFIFRCSSAYVTRWNVTLLPTKGTSYIESRRENQNPFQVSNLTFISEFRIIIGQGNSGWIKCQNVLKINENQTAGVYVFSQSGDDMVGDEENDFKLNLNVPLEVKCTANKPDVRPRLEEEINEDEYEEIDPSRILKPYDPRYGFVVQGTEKEDQRYKCVTDDHEFLHNFKTIETSIKNQELNEGSTEDAVEVLKIDTGFLATGQGGGEITNERLSDVACDSDQTYIIIFKMIRCTSIYHCDWLNICFEKCYLKYDAESQEKRARGKYVTLTNPFSAGMINCYVWLGSKRFIKYYFIGLDRLSYLTDGSTIPKTALIRVNTDGQEIYTKQSTRFLCEISTFLLVVNIQFAVVFRNGTKKLLNEDFYNSSNSVIEYNSLALVEYEDRGFAQREITLNLTKEMQELVCLAPWYNSSEWIQQSISFRPRDVVLPSIEKSGESETRTLHVDQKDQLLHCSAKGEPRPQIKWIFPDPKLEEVIKLSESTEGESTLTFPNDENIYSFKGTYKCVASSIFGNDTYNFDVQVQDSSLSTPVICGICLASVGFLAVVAGIIYFGYKYHFAREKIRDLTEEEINEFTNGNEDEASRNQEATTPQAAQTKGFKQAYVIAEEDLVIAKDSILGHGEYGMVYRGIYHGDAVAVKTTKPNADVSYFKALLLELKTMSYIGEHPHVVQFMGAVTNRIRERIIFAVLELSPLGNLNSYLRKIGPGFCNLLPNVDGKIATYENIDASVTQLHMISWCEQIADGMAHLAQKQVCHGDLATRNVLVFKNDVVKITDFGLSKQLYNYTNYIKKKAVPLPWRWLAIETLRYMEFSSRSDVWAFGVTMWEIFTLSQVPYPGEAYTIDFIEKLQKGHRLMKPIFAPQSIYDLMLKCWHEQSESRPLFGHLSADLHAILKDESLFKIDDGGVPPPLPGPAPKRFNTYTKLATISESSAKTASNPEPEIKVQPLVKKASNSEPEVEIELQPTAIKPVPKPRMFSTKRLSRRISYINVGKLKNNN